MSLTELAIKRPSLVVVLFSALSFFGYISLTSLSYELMPKFEFPVMTIMSIYPGASPSEVENSVVKKLEESVSDLEGIENLRGVSQENIGLVIIQLGNQTNVDKALSDAQRKVNQVLPMLPKNAKTPTINKFGFSEMPVLRMGVSSTMEATAFYDVVKNKIQPAIAAVQGVAQVGLIGGEERIIKVNIRKDDLAKYNLSMLQVTQAVGVSNLDFPTGKIKNDNTEVLIRLAGKYKSVDELNNLIVARMPYTNTEIRLNQVADVQDAKRDIDKLNRINGVNAIGIDVRKQSEANAVDVSKAARVVLAKLEKEYAKDKLKFGIASDGSEFTMQAAEAVQHDLMLAIFLVAAVMLLFLHSLRSAVIVMVAIPASLVATFIAMYLLGFTLNLMTLLALSLVIGILVDDSIVVLENIYRHLEMGKDRVTASLVGRNEIGFTALAITLVDVVVFLPLTMVKGLVANILGQFSYVVVIATLCSLFVSFTVTPLLASRFASVIHLDNKNVFGWLIIQFERFIDYVANEFATILKGALYAWWTKGIALLLAFGLFMASFQLIAQGYIGSEFVNPGDRGEFIIKIEMPKETPLEITNRITNQIEHHLFTKKEITTVFATAGMSSDILGSQTSSNKSDIQIKLVPSEERAMHTDIFAKNTKKELDALFPGVKISCKPVSILGGADQDPIQLVLNGTNLDSVMHYAGMWRDSIAKISGVLGAELSISTGNPEINVSIDRDKMSSLGLTLDGVGATLQTAYTGNTDSKYRDGNYEYDINVQLDAFDRKSRSDLEDLTFMNSKGQIIALQQFAEIKQGIGPGRLERNNRLPSVTIRSGVLGRPSGSIGADIQALLDRNYKPASVVYQWDGDMKNQQEAGGQMGIAGLASILLVYLIMVALYDSYVYPLVVLFSIPLAVIGALLALALTQQSLSIFTGIGLIMLIGLVAKNAILIVDFTNQLKAEGKPVKEALIESGKTRLRPILMTTFSMIIGMLPIALAKGPGAEWKNGLAWALIGGLTSSMFLTLVVVPVVYSVVESLKNLGLRMVGGTPSVESAAEQKINAAVIDADL
jgi:hydrophobic/amphiphilic exporter-1 (mainly G- bacteria), HAE1 family